MSVVDAAQRAQALDVCNSFCVTAPAGSGKTELLIQRFLALLARVQRPEQVLAITFTRKAAAEMRLRVMTALQQAQEDAPCEGQHQEVTRALAVAVLARDLEADWHLARDSNRLNIRTIDGFCASLTRQMPILSEFGGQAQTVDDAAELYAEAVSELFGLLGTGTPLDEDLRALLLHFDNNWERLRQLLVAMLGRRDQWHEYMGVHHQPQESEAALRATVEAVVAESLADVHALLDPFQDELYDLLCYSLENLEQPLPGDFPAPRAAAVGHWRQLRAMFLTQKGDWRKSVTRREGFPTGKGEASERKEHLQNLADRLRSIAGLQQALHAIAWLPDTSASSDSWQIVLRLSHVLPNLAACLLLVFRRHGQVDHSQVALSALTALGTDDAPTELALRLDYAIEHILVDEFQDTAISQYRLVSRLTRGWGEHNQANPDAPRTIFIVGDGMQSIYGFRDANVGLFLKAKNEGFNGVLPQSVALQCNFRSDRGVVDWVNATFRQAFPAEDDVRRGRVAFTEAVAVRPAGSSAAVSMHAFHGEQAREQEAALLVRQVQEALADPAVNSVAILGRSRGQLAPVLAHLQAAGIPFAAQEMERLAGSAVIVDLMSLCRALANPADRVAWFALLRAPWCGLTLADLRALAGNGREARYSNLQGVLPGHGGEGLSPDGRKRLQHLVLCLAWAARKRDRLALRVWVEQLWLRLGGAATVTEEASLEDAAIFFSLLQQAEQEGVGLDVDWLQRRLDKLYASGRDAGARLQVMTLHKSKGLEFDWVLIPALASTTRGERREILLWDEHNSPGGERGFLLAADEHSDDKAPTLYNFLKRTRREKSRLESTRLLYVGATRAARRLVLTACLNAQETDEAVQEAVRLKPPGEASLLHSIWPVFEQQATVHAPAVLPAAAPMATARPLWRLQSLPSPVAAPTASAGGPNIPEPSRNRLDRHVGTVIHRALEELSLMQTLPVAVPQDRAPVWRAALRQLGLAGESLEIAWVRVQQAVDRTLADCEHGRWLLDAGHADAHSELALTRVIQGQVADIVIDRTFIDRATGLRWVVDYKSSGPAEGECPEAFCSRERESYRGQLRGYRDAMADWGEEPLRCGLYFTSISRFIHLDELDA